MRAATSLKTQSQTIAIKQGGNPLMFPSKSNRQKKPPIKDRSLPQPGESLAHQARELWDDKVMYWVIVTTATGALALFEWIHHTFKTPPQPWFMTILFICTAMFTV